MKPLSLNLSKVKKIGGDARSSVFQHPDGHKIHIAHSGVSALQRKQLENMPVHKMAEGGEAEAPKEKPDEFNDMVSSLNPANWLKGDPAAQQSAHEEAMASLPKYPGDNGQLVAQADQSQDQVQSNQSSAQQEQPSAEIPSAGGESKPSAQQSLNASGTVPASALNDQESAVKNALGAEQQSAKNIAGAWRSYGEQSAKIMPVESLIQQRQVADDAFQKQFLAAKVDPNRYWHDKSTGQKIAAAIGMILGGAGAAGAGQPNYAMDIINKGIENDIKAQENEQGKSMTLWKMNREATNSAVQANLMTRNQLLTATEAKIKMFQAQAGGAEAQLKMAPLLMDIQRQKQENNLRLALSAPADKTGVSDIDPAQLVPHLVKNPEQQNKVYGEIAAAQNTKHMGASILKSFEDAAKENTIMRTGANPFGQLRTPGSVFALHQAMQPTFADLEGTVRQAAMDNTFKNITPAPGDSEHTIQQKREALHNYLQSKSSAPIAKGNGLDLARFNSTSPYASAPKNEGMTASNARGDRLIMKNGQWVAYGK